MDRGLCIFNLYTTGLTTRRDFKMKISLPLTFFVLVSCLYGCSAAYDAAMKIEKSKDNFQVLMGTFDGEIVETVGIPTDKRLTVCVSSQIGCPMGCKFCATGKGGLNRSLDVNEIVDQVISVRETMNRRPTHVVFMGMGEPLLNIRNVLDSIECLTSDIGIGQRKITVSTVGIPNTLSVGIPTVSTISPSKVPINNFNVSSSATTLLNSSSLPIFIPLLSNESRHFLGRTVIESKLLAPFT